MTDDRFGEVPEMEIDETGHSAAPCNCNNLVTIEQLVCTYIYCTSQFHIAFTINGGFQTTPTVSAFLHSLASSRIHTISSLCFCHRVKGRGYCGWVSLSMKTSFGRLPSSINMDSC